MINNITQGERYACLQNSVKNASFLVLIDEVKSIKIHEYYETYIFR